MSGGPPLRILQVIPFFTPRHGGCVTNAWTRLACLAARGHTVRVVTSDLGLDSDDARPRDEWLRQPEGFDVFHASTSRPWHRVPPYAPPPAAKEILASVIPESDVVMANVGLTLWNQAVRRIGRGTGAGRIPYVYNAEGALCPTRLRIKALSKRAFLAAVERGVLADAARCQSVTQKEAHDLERLGVARERIHVVPNSVASVPAIDDAERSRARSALGLAPHAVLVAFVGRLHAIKGIDLLLEAVASLATSRPELVLRIAGPDDGARADLESQIAELGLGERVRFVGMLDARGRTELLAAADVFALTSRTEGLPLAALEAAAAGVPLLLTDACHIPEVAMREAGLVVAADAGAVERGLRRLVEDVAFRESCRANARAMVEDTFRVEIVIERIEAMLRSAVAS